YPALSLRAYGESAVPMPLPLAAEFGRVLGQPLRPAPRPLGLLAPHPLGHARHDQGRQAGLGGAVNAPPGESRSVLLKHETAISHAVYDPELTESGHT